MVWGRRKNMNEPKLRDEDSRFVCEEQHLVSLGIQCAARSGNI